jgi:hypothetical protein
MKTVMHQQCWETVMPFIALSFTGPLSGASTITTSISINKCN